MAEDMRRIVGSAGTGSALNLGNEKDTAAAGVAIVNTKEETIRAQTADFNRRLREEPHNPQLWRAYVKFQASGVGPEAKERAAKVRQSMTWACPCVRGIWAPQEEAFEVQGMRSRRAQAMLLDRQMRIYEQAVEKNPHSEVAAATSVNLGMERAALPQCHHACIRRQACLDCRN
jgi:hypothetical protein